MLQEYLIPKDTSEVLEMLASYKGKARVIAGGTDLVLQMDAGQHLSEALVDVSGLPEMRRIDQDERYTYIGAAVKHAELASSPLINKIAKCLALAAEEVGSPQVRNAGTVGGNVVNAQPAADTALALTALNAEAEIISINGTTWQSVSQLYEKPGVSKVNSTSQLIRRFRFLTPGAISVSSYRRVGKCKSIALPVLCAAVVVHLENDVIQEASIVLGPVAPAPMHAELAEHYLSGKQPSLDVIKEAANLAQSESRPRDSLLRCSRMYRETLAGVLVENTLLDVLQCFAERQR